MNPLFGLGVMGKGLFRGPERPVMGEDASLSVHHAQLVMEHLVIKDIFDHISRNGRAVQYRMNSYDFAIVTITSEAYGFGSTAPFPRPPGNRTTCPASKIGLVESMEIHVKVHVLSFRIKTRDSWFYRGWPNTDLLSMIRDEVFQQGSPPQGRPPNEGGKHSQDILSGSEKHPMKANRAGPAFPLHGNHRPRIIRDGQRQRGIQKLPKPGFHRRVGTGRWNHCILSRLLLVLFIVETPVSLKTNLWVLKEGPF